MPKTNLVTLGLLSRRPLHPYAIDHWVKFLHLDHWASISRAAIYNTLARFEKTGEVRVTIETEAGKTLPVRKLYAITSKGRRRLRCELRDAILTLSLNDSPFHVAGMFLFDLSADETVALCRERRGLLEGVIDQLTAQRRQHIRRGMSHIVYSLDAAIQHMTIEHTVAGHYIDLLAGDPGYFVRYADTMHQMLLVPYTSEASHHVSH